jgi:hypothetical protein
VSNNLICYSSGGLSNRLLPLISSLYLANKTNRKISIVWPSTFLRCQCSFSDLFYNHLNIYNLSFDQLEALTDVIIYSNEDAAQYEATLNNTQSLLSLYKKYPIKPLSSIQDIPKDTHKNVLIFSNKALPGISSPDLFHSLQKLIPVSKITRAIKDFPIKLDKSWTGVHLRSTDFNVNLDYYLNQMSVIYTQNPNVKFFVCSDNKEWEQQIKDEFPVIEYREKTVSVRKKHLEMDWNNNVETPMEAVQEALIDLYLLGKTTIRVGHPNSSFLALAKLISENS